MPAMSIRDIEARARSQAIHKTVNMLEEALGIRGKGKTPKARRRMAVSKVRQLRKMLE